MRRNHKTAQMQHREQKSHWQWQRHVFFYQPFHNARELNSRMGKPLHHKPIGQYSKYMLSRKHISQLKCPKEWFDNLIPA